MKKLILPVLIILSSNLFSQQKTDSIKITENKEWLNDYSQKERAINQRIIVVSKNREELMNSTIITDSERNYTFDEFYKILPESIDSISLLKDDESIAKYTTEKSIKCVILMKLKE